ncbi:MAG: DUF1501 domain-containing protein [Planctomycetota bacterium]|nr:DUF1501 domain-containing protein [Planctomycetota bacterium]
MTNRNHPYLTRRAALGGIALGAAGLALLGRHPRSVWAAPKRKRGKEPKAKAVIELWMAGGPTHIDTWDPKPGAGRDYTGPLTGTVETNVSGIRLGESLPMLAKHADKYSVIRSMTHGINGHETAAYITQTGRRPGTGEQRLVYPSLGAIVSAFKGYRNGYEGMIPPYVVLTRPQGRFAVEGFLGLTHKPFVTGGDPRRDRFEVEGIVLQGVSDERQRSRRELLKKLDSLGRAMGAHPALEKMDRCEQKAYDLILGDAGRVFNLKQEKAAVRDRYGRTTFGQSCLAARRLVEAGVPYVTVNSGGWDTHKRHFESMRQKLPDLDRGMSALLEDLQQRGLLESTVVWWSGEFGRGPRVQWEEPWNGGRSHYGRCFSAVVAGGGFEGGHVIGKSDARAETVAERPVEPHDLISSILLQLGIDPDARMPNDRNLDVTVQPKSKKGRDVGRLTEIMG